MPVFFLGIGRWPRCPRPASFFCLGMRFCLWVWRSEALTCGWHKFTMCRALEGVCGVVGRAQDALMIGLERKTRSLRAVFGVGAVAVASAWAGSGWCSRVSTGAEWIVTSDDSGGGVRRDIGEGTEGFLSSFRRTSSVEKGSRVWLLAGRTGEVLGFVGRGFSADPARSLKRLEGRDVSIPSLRREDERRAGAVRPSATARMAFRGPLRLLTAHRAWAGDGVSCSRGESSANLG